MKSVDIFNWDNVRDWLAEAGRVCGGFYLDCEDERVRRPILLPRRWFDGTGRVAAVEPARREPGCWRQS